MTATAPSAARLTLLADVPGHRARRGAFTAAGGVMRAVVPALLAADPDLVQRYDIEVLAAAPELGAVLDCRRETLTSQADPQTRTRYYPHHRSVWIGSGLTDLTLAAARRLGGGQTLVVSETDDLDPTDAAWLAGLVRRADPSVLRVVTEPGCREPGSDVEGFVRALCLPAAPALRTAYDALSERERWRLHDAEGDRLEALAEPSLERGALVFHRERGSDRVLAVRVAAAAQQEALMAGTYDRVVELGRTVRRLVAWDADEEARWLATVKMTIAHQAMGEPDEAMELFDEACASSVAPSVHMQSAYGRAMVYTRYYDEPRRDLRKAKGLINTAVVLAGLSKDDQRRAYNRTFNENGLALVDMHLGEIDAAVELIESGIARLDREVEGGRYLLHRSVLRYNHAQLMVRVGDVDRAMAEYTRILQEDPHHPDYWFERAALWEQQGRLTEAIEDYSEAIRVAPPYPEPIYNRGDLRLRVGDVDGALADFSRVIELDPTFVLALVNRASLRLDAGELDGAAADVAAGLALQPDDPHLLALRGLVTWQSGDVPGALDWLDRAVLAGPDVAEAWANLGALRYDAGDHAGAVTALERSLALADTAEVRDNLELVLAS